MQLQIFKAALPESIHGVSAKQGEELTVLINDQETADEQALTFLHEMLHIWHNDHDREGVNVSDLEAERREEMKRLLLLCL